MQIYTGVHPAGTKDASAEATSGLPTDLHNAGAHALAWRRES